MSELQELADRVVDAAADPPRSNVAMTFLCHVRKYLREQHNAGLRTASFLGAI